MFNIKGIAILQKLLYSADPISGIYTDKSMTQQMFMQKYVSPILCSIWYTHAVPLSHSNPCSQSVSDTGLTTEINKNKTEPIAMHRHTAILQTRGDCNLEMRKSGNKCRW